MWEMFYIVVLMRFLIVMVVINRVFFGFINIYNDYLDLMGVRDSGWIQIYCENNQEVYDFLIQVIRIVEYKDVRFFVMVCYDGFIISYVVENIEFLEDEFVKKFVGEYNLEFYFLNE